MTSSRQELCTSVWCVQGHAYACRHTLSSRSCHNGTSCHVLIAKHCHCELQAWQTLSLPQHSTAQHSRHKGCPDLVEVLRSALQCSALCAFEDRSQRTLAHCFASCRFDTKCKRIQAESPHGRRPAWAVRPVIVKSGDDCRQELLAVQLISTFHDIFQARNVQSVLFFRNYFLCLRVSTLLNSCLFASCFTLGQIHCTSSMKPMLRRVHGTCADVCVMPPLCVMSH